MNRTTRKPRPEKSVSDTCPKCGYCDKCGRSNAAPVIPWPYPYVAPYVPYVPPTNTWPYRPYWQPNGTTPITSVIVSGTSTAPGAVISNEYVSKPNDPFVVGHAFTGGLAAGNGITLTNTAN